MADYLAIEWDKRSLAVVEASIGRGEGDIARAFRIPWEMPEDETPQARGESLRKQLREQGATASKAVLVLPRDAFAVRRLDLPNAPDDELPDLVRFQAATRSATPLETLALDYIPLPREESASGRHVLLFSIDAHRLKDLTATLEAAGLHPTSCVVSTVAAAQCVAHAASTGKAGLMPGVPTLIVYQHKARVEISILDRGQLIFSHATRLPETTDATHVNPLKAELARSIVALGQLHPGVEVEQTVLIQEEGEDPSVESMLQDRFGERLHRLTPGEHTQLQSGRGVSTLPVIPLGALESLLEPTIVSVDLLNPRKAAAKPDRTRLRIGMGAAAAVLLLGTAYWMYRTEVASREDEIAYLEQRQDDLDAILQRGQPQLESAGEIDAWLAQAPSPLDVLTEFRDLLPETDRLYLTNLQYAPAARDAVATIRGSGYARSRRDAEDLYQALADNGYRVRPHEVEISRRDPEYPVTFELDVDAVREETAEESEGA
ncbi:Competence protein A [Maioricimonas rarisocia]|uniref:Competence protein A n=1 Tax=Maioricimonas rarisocia TaxID=2528026 RepID=A0A517Z5L6_9PLAN|nr:hypothetical protein [Maioricimonas rarisocia]QDU37741.1 Competence protein A [Maioricimonas rarisocia]